MTFPSSVLPNVVASFDGTLAQYADAAGTSPVSAFRAPVRRVNEASPLSGNWQAADDAHDAFHDASGVRLDFAAPASLVRSATAAVSCQNSTLSISFVTRGTFYATQGLIGCFAGGGYYGLIVYQNLLYVMNTAGTYDATAIPILPGVRYTVVVRYVGGTIKIRVLANGVATDYLPGFSYSNVSTSTPLQIGHSLIASGFYGSISQMRQCDRSLTDQETADLGVWQDAQPLPEAFPLDCVLVNVLGDSIAAASWGWPRMVQGALRGAYPNVEIYNAAVPGSFTSTLNAQYADTVPFYSAARACNIDVIASGTNDTAGLVAPSVSAANIFARVDASLSAGRRVVVATVLPRSVDTLGSPAQLAFDANRATQNNLIAAGVAARPGVQLADVRTVAGMGADGDSRNTTLYSDGTHPREAGYVLMAPVYTAAIAGALSLGGVPLVVQRLYDGNVSPPKFVFGLPLTN